MVFVKHWYESAMDLHVFPIPIPPPTSLSTRSLWVFPVHQAGALVSCIQPGLVICFTLDIIHISMLMGCFEWNFSFVNCKYISITSWQIDGETMETVTDFILGGSKITADGDCSHEIKRCLLLGRKAMTNLDSILKSRDITLPTKVHLVKAMVFPVVTYRCETWTIKKVECWRIDAFELWCWKRLLRVPWTAKRSNQSILKEISPKYSFKGLMLKLKL